jgi:hypothetical protein
MMCVHPAPQKRSRTTWATSTRKGDGIIERRTAVAHRTGLDTPLESLQGVGKTTVGIVQTKSRALDGGSEVREGRAVEETRADGVSDPDRHATRWHLPPWSGHLAKMG